jgi:hypothetical protein
MTPQQRSGADSSTSPFNTRLSVHVATCSPHPVPSVVDVAVGSPLRQAAKDEHVPSNLSASETGFAAEDAPCLVQHIKQQQQSFSTSCTSLKLRTTPVGYGCKADVSGVAIVDFSKAARCH